MLCLCHDFPALLRFWFQTNHGRENSYLLLAEFSVRTVNYGPSFFPSSAKRAGHKSMRKNEDP